MTDRPVEVSEWVLDRIMNRVETPDGPAWHINCSDDLEGYIIIWSDGSHMHTYHRPENILKEA